MAYTTARISYERVKLFSRYKSHKPDLTPEDKKARLEWAHTYKSWTEEDWRKVLFSDECRVHVEFDSTRQRLINAPEGTWYTKCIKIMVWGSFYDGDNGPLIVEEKKEDGSDGY